MTTVRSNTRVTTAVGTRSIQNWELAGEPPLMASSWRDKVSAFVARP